MRWKLGKAFTLTADVPATPAAPAVAKLDVEEELKSLDGYLLTIGLPPAPADQYNWPTKMRVYLVPSGQPQLADGDAYDQSSYPFVEVDVPATPETGCDLPITLPTVDRVAPHIGQVVHGYES